MATLDRERGRRCVDAVGRPVSRGGGLRPMRPERDHAGSPADGRASRRGGTIGISARTRRPPRRPRGAAVHELHERHEPAVPDQRAALGDPQRPRRRRAAEIETTLLPDTRIIEWSPGQCVRTLVSQFVAYEGGQIKEVALDHYAQADDGSVWYFGEDVFNYEHGVVADTGGTWLAGKEGPAAMIMPGPAVGDVNRPENIPGLVFEEVTIKESGKTVHGPRGSVQERSSAASCTTTARVRTSSSRPATASSAPRARASSRRWPSPCRPMRPQTRSPPSWVGSSTARPARSGPPAPAIWRAASSAVDGISKAWRADRPGGTPPRLVAPLTRALDALDRAVTRRRSRTARSTALDVAQATLDLRLRYRPPAEIDRARFALWARQGTSTPPRANGPRSAGMSPHSPGSATGWHAASTASTSRASTTG